MPDHLLHRPLFSAVSTTVLRVGLAGLALTLCAAAFFAFEYYHSPYWNRVGFAPDQPVLFSHRHHAGELGIYCRYCHATVEKSGFAGLPSTHTCMTCHSQIFTDTPMLQPVVESAERGAPLHWNQVNSLPDHVCFQHDIHIAKGGGWVSQVFPRVTTASFLARLWRQAPLSKIRSGRSVQRFKNIRTGRDSDRLAFQSASPIAAWRTHRIGTQLNEGESMKISVFGFSLLRGGLSVGSCLLATVALLGAALPSAAAPVGETESTPTANVRSIDSSPEITDSTLQNAVQQRLATELGLNLNNIKVSVDGNNVTFEGKFANIGDANRAVEIASSVRGVLSVQNRAAVSPAPRADKTVAADVRSALQHDPATRPLDAAANVNDGIVTLSGQVETWLEKDLAQWVAENVRGVRRVENRIQIKPISTSDSDVAERIRRRIRGDALVDGDVNVSVTDGVATLRGKVGSALERNWAIADAWVPGVQQLATTDLKVDPQITTKPRAQHTPSDEDIRRSIIDGFVLDPRIKAYNPDVTVKGGAVMLSGTVANVKAKQAAAQIAEHTRGVRKVENQLEVRYDAQRTDPQIAEDIEGALQRSPSLDPDNVSVAVDHGVVTLTGRVDNFLQRWIAEDIAARTSGVARVNDQVRVKGALEMTADEKYFYYPSLHSHQPWLYWFPTTKKTDPEIRLGIRLNEFWDPFLRDNKIDVSVEKGVATLSGEVDNEFEQRVAEENAYRGGAWKVINQLKLNSASNSIVNTE